MGKQFQFWYVLKQIQGTTFIYNTYDYAHLASA